MSQRGSASIIGITGVLVMCTFALAAAGFGAMLHARARAQAAADAAALAAVTNQAPVLGLGEDPEGAARTEAERNGAQLVSCECGVGSPSATVEVVVRPVAAGWPWAERIVRARASASVDPDVFSYR